MKHISLFLTALALCAGPRIAGGQDAATEERLRQLSGKIEDLIAGQEALRKRIGDLSKDLDNVREQQSKPGNYASHDDLKRLSDAIKDVDRKRIEDNEHTRAEILKLGKIFSTPPQNNTPSSTKKKSTPASEDVSSNEKSGKKEQVAEYVVKAGDNLSLIAAAYREKNVKVTVDQIVKANPGLVPEKMHPGQKIYVPLTQ